MRHIHSYQKEEIERQISSRKSYDQNESDWDADILSVGVNVDSIKRLTSRLFPCESGNLPKEHIFCNIRASKKYEPSQKASSFMINPFLLLCFILLKTLTINVSLKTKTLRTIIFSFLSFNFKKFAIRDVVNFIRLYDVFCCSRLFTIFGYNIKRHRSNAALISSISCDVYVSIIAPSLSPAIFNNPIVLCISNDGYGMCNK